MAHPAPDSDPAAAARDTRFVSVASRLALMIFALVASVSFVLAFALAGREYESSLEAKRRAAEMLTELLAAAVAPALDFGDAEGLASALDMLSRNTQVLDAAVWPPGAQKPLARLVRGGAAGLPERLPESAAISAEHIDIVRAVHSPNGVQLGTLVVRVSLAQERQAVASARRWIFWLAFGLSAIVAALLVAVVRSMIVSPLRELERAARRLARGELLLVVEGRYDEVGSLGRAFNRMGQVIGEREQRISAMNGRLQGLLDHMRQAILVFDEQGCLGIERSRLARQIFGTAAGSETNIVDLLFPAGVASEVERDAFRIWLSEAAQTLERNFDEVSALAPKEAVLEDVAGERLLELEFRPAAADGAGKRFMLLATDVTSHRALERSAEFQVRQHQKQLTAMRRLLAGGGQMFVQFLTSARQRLSRAEHSFQAAGQLTPELLEEAFRFVHTLRAEARSFDLEQVEALVSELELGLGGARHAPPAAEVRTAAARQLREGFGRLARELQKAEQLFVQSSPIGRRVLDQVTVSRQDVAELFGRVGARQDALGQLARRLASRPFGELASGLPDALQRWSNMEGKLVELVLEGREALVPAPLTERLAGVLAHLLRNAVAHGIETPFQRRALGKPDAGRVELSCQELPDGVCIQVQDDGAGFDLAGLQRCAGEQGHSAQAELELAFLAGVSTRQVRDDLAGNGVGMGAVRDDLAELGYKVSVSSQAGQGARIRIEPQAWTRTEARE